MHSGNRFILVSFSVGILALAICFQNCSTINRRNPDGTMNLASSSMNRQIYVNKYDRIYFDSQTEPKKTNDSYDLYIDLNAMVVKPVNYKFIELKASENSECSSVNSSGHIELTEDERAMLEQVVAKGQICFHADGGNSNNCGRALSVLQKVSLTKKIGQQPQVHLGRASCKENFDYCDAQIRNVQDQLFAEIRKRVRGFWRSTRSVVWQSLLSNNKPTFSLNFFSKNRFYGSLPFF